MDKSYVGLMACHWCGETIGVLLDKRLKETFEHGKSYDAGELCDRCKEIEASINAGGIPFVCDECERFGAINADSEFAIAWKEAFPDEKKGVRFENCEQHGGSDGQE